MLMEAERPAARVPVDLPALLLLEPDYVMRQTVALIASSNGLARVVATGSHERVGTLVARQRFDGFIIAIDSVHDDLYWIETIRAGRTACDSDAPITVLADRMDHALAQQLRTHRVRRILVKPCRVRTLVGALSVYATR
jgi:DNA-binding response OmpR family regulator